MPKLRALPIAILVLSLTSPCYARGGMGGGMGGVHGGIQGGFHDFRDGRFRGQGFFVRRPAFFVQRRAFFVPRRAFFVQRPVFFAPRPVFFAPRPVFFGFGFGGFAPFYPSYAFASPTVIYVLPPAAAPQAAPAAPTPLPPPPSATPPPATSAPPPARDAYYFCPASKGYYPYVATCAVAWPPYQRHRPSRSRDTRRQHHPEQSRARLWCGSRAAQQRDPPRSSRAGRVPDPSPAGADRSAVWATMRPRSC